jgi:agmatine deiminase
MATIFMNVSRRKFNAAAAALISFPGMAVAKPSTFLMPAEWHPHKACYMAFSAAVGVYSQKQITRIRREQAMIAKAIARFEPVIIFTNTNDVAAAKTLCGPTVAVQTLAHFDIWTRDTLPSMVLDTAGRIQAVSWNFNVWGEKFRGYDLDRDLATRFAATLKLPLVKARLVAEGGAMDVDGEGTMLTTESCLLNSNRNPEMTRQQVERELKRMTGANKIIWLPGSKADAVTDGHIDGIARFIRPGVVVSEVTDDRHDPEYKDLQKSAEILESAIDAKGRKLDVIRLKRPRWDVMPSRGNDFAASYVNCYFPNGGIILPVFGDPERDRAASGLFRELMPDREMVHLRVDEICEGGGGIHCNTQHLPSVLP